MISEGFSDPGEKKNIPGSFDGYFLLRHKRVPEKGVLFISRAHSQKKQRSAIIRIAETF
jgi:hypothetical protein